jgi:hypothetical protein
MYCAVVNYHTIQEPMLYNMTKLQPYMCILPANFIHCHLSLKFALLCVCEICIAVGSMYTMPALTIAFLVGLWMITRECLYRYLLSLGILLRHVSKFKTYMVFCTTSTVYTTVYLPRCHRIYHWIAKRGLWNLCLTNLATLIYVKLTYHELLYNKGRGLELPDSPEVPE